MKWEEENLQIRCVKYLTYRYSHLVWHHSPNEAKRTRVQAGYEKQCGMRPGWPDLEILDQDKIVFVEFKAPKVGRQSPEQKKVQALLEKLGYMYSIIRTYEEFVELCHNQFGEERDPDLERLREIIGS